jgi:hypothetical protein
MITYDVISYDAAGSHHTVCDDEGMTRFVDLMVNGDFPEDTDPNSLVGKRFDADYDYPLIAIAMNVRPHTTKSRS